MALTSAEARDEMLTRFYDDWRAKAPLVWAGGVPHVSWQAVDESPSAVRADEPWARVTITHNVSPQRTLGEPGARRFDRLGLIIVQIFTPLSLSQGIALADELGTIVRDAFEGRDTPGGVWFRNVRQQELGPSSPWWQLNIVAEFIYDEIK